MSLCNYIKQEHTEETYRVAAASSTFSVMLRSLEHILSDVTLSLVAELPILAPDETSILA